ncbi:hypothetical protein SEA_ORLA_68 [Gordonia phage Orla]|nr:hypothetical protein SEA_ORLA_68 [Gordonia phage Orla]WNN96158.1 hypothetical protein SEA_NODIGI_67 [Gordonia phage Nodigi]
MADRMVQHPRIPERLWPDEAIWDGERWVTVVDGERRTSDSLRGMYSVINTSRVMGKKAVRP